MRTDIEIRKLFSDYTYCLDNTLQRPYEWDKEKVVKFINDIVNNKLKTDEGATIRYNVGDFITYDEHNEEIPTKCIFDGQQRITTIMLLFANILHHKPLKNGYRIEQLLYAPCWRGEEQKVKRLRLRNNDDIILGKLINNGISDLSKEEKKSCLVKNYMVISSEFTDRMNESELDDFYNSIINNASYFERECETRLEGIRQFNNLNGWHQSLKQSRVGISTLYQIFRENNKTNEDIETFLCSLSNMDDNDAKEFIALFLYYKGCDYKEKGFPVVIESLVKQGVNVLDDASTFFKTTYQDIIEHATGNNVSDVLNTPFLSQTPLRTVYVDLFTDKINWVNELQYDKKCDIYKKFEWGYISNVVKRAAAGGQSRLSGILASYKPEFGDPVKYVENELRNRGIFISADELKDYRTNSNELFTSMLLRVEYQYCKSLNIKEPVRPIDIVTAEHIHPQRPRKGVDYNCDNNLTQTIGNFTLMGKRGNGSNSNKPFNEKIDLYRISPYLINSQHLCNYDNWTNEKIYENANWYIELFKQFYGIS
jgi:hypothetical protein